MMPFHKKVPYRRKGSLVQKNLRHNERKETGEINTNPMIVLPRKEAFEKENARKKIATPFAETEDKLKLQERIDTQDSQEDSSNFRKNSTHRSWHLTINNPTQYGFDHQKIHTLLAEKEHLRYYCMSDELGDCHHTHLYLYFQDAVRFSAIKKLFPTAHIEEAKGTAEDNIAYIQKSGKWEHDVKHGTLIPGTFEEWGNPPQSSPKEASKASMKRLYQLIYEGKTNAEIYRENPNFMQQAGRINQIRNDIQSEQIDGSWRSVEVNYLYGETGIGKSRYVIEKFGYKNVFRVTNYKHPFDRYKGQDVVVFEEFRGQLPLIEMLNYLDIYYCLLPCRYGDQTSLYTKVYIISNEPFHTLYPWERRKLPDTYKAFCQRIAKIGHLKDYLKQDALPANSLPKDSPEDPSDCSLASP